MLEALEDDYSNLDERTWEDIVGTLAEEAPARMIRVYNGCVCARPQFYFNILLLKQVLSSSLGLLDTISLPLQLLIASSSPAFTTTHSSRHLQLSYREPVVSLTNTLLFPREPVVSLLFQPPNPDRNTSPVDEESPAAASTALCSEGLRAEKRATAQAREGLQTRTGDGTILAKLETLVV